MNQRVTEKLRLPGSHGGAWLTLGSPVITELAAALEFEWMLLDLEHGYCTEATLLSSLQAGKSADTALIVRVGQLNPAWISRALDWGADGIMLPHVNTADQAASCVEAMRYPPGGSRGFSSSVRAFRYGMDPYRPEEANPLFFAQIETCEGVANAEAIAQVPGVDVLFVGPSDLRMDYELYGKGQFGDFSTALAQVVKAAKAAGKQAGILAKSPEDVNNYRQIGFTTVAYGSDLSFLREGLKKAKHILGSAE